MRLTHLVAMAVLMGAVAVIGCGSDDNGDGGSGGTAGTGGTGGGGGTGGDGGAGGGGTGGDGGTGGTEVVQVFVTSDAFDGNLGGLDGADTKCADAASAAGLGGNWTAWLSDTATNAGERIPDAEYQLLDGTVVANDLADLTDGTLDAPIDLDEIRGTGGTQVVQVFVTSGTFDGDLGGLGGADTKCTEAASAAGLGGDWTAWLSDATTNARARIGDGEYRLLDGTTVIADDLADLTDGTLNAAINLDENEDTVMADIFAWTSTAEDGINQGFGSCVSWSVNVDTSSGRVGEATATDATWTSSGGRTCDTERRLYCFSARASSEVWTSTADDGINQGFGACVNWTVNVDANSGRVGESTAADATWTSLGGRACDRERRLYCFSGPEL